MKKDIHKARSCKETINIKTITTPIIGKYTITDDNIVFVEKVDDLGGI